jgi:hypothetical protein
MALNTRRAACRREEDARDTKSNTEGVVSWSRLISELAVSRVRERNPSYIPPFPSHKNGSSKDTIEPNTDSVIEENKIKNYIKLV